MTLTMLLRLINCRVIIIIIIIILYCLCSAFDVALHKSNILLLLFAFLFVRSFVFFLLDSYYNCCIVIAICEYRYIHMFRVFSSHLLHN